MINVKTYREYFERAVSEIPELQGCIVVAAEEALAKKIKDIDSFPLLVAVIPSADPHTFDSDNFSDSNIALLFVLTRRGKSNYTEETFLDDLETTQGIISQLKLLMIADMQDCSSAGHPVMKNLDPGSFHQDPEYNYLGCDGWSLSFQFVTGGF